MMSHASTPMVEGWKHNHNAMKKEHWVTIGVIVVVLSFGLILARISEPVGPGVNQNGSVDPAAALSAPLGPLAQCLTDKGAKFYGAFWCSHCQNQKKAFGDAASLLPYVECSTPDSRGLTPVCAAAKIEAFPTWVFPDGTMVQGEIAIDDLAARAGCVVSTSDSDSVVGV
jgi:hypothetical protein